MTWRDPDWGLGISVGGTKPTRRQILGAGGVAVATLGVDRAFLHSLGSDGNQRRDTAYLGFTDVRHSPDTANPGDEVVATMGFENYSNRDINIQANYLLEDPNDVKFANPEFIASATIPAGKEARLQSRWTVSDNAIDGAYTGTATITATVDSGGVDGYRTIRRSDSLNIENPFVDISQFIDGTVQTLQAGVDAVISTGENVYSGLKEIATGLWNAPGAAKQGLVEGFKSGVEGVVGAVERFIDNPVRFANSLFNGLMKILRNLDRPRYLLEKAVQGTADMMENDAPDYNNDYKHDAFVTGWGVGFAIINILYEYLGILAASKLSKVIRAQFNISRSLKAAAAIKAIGRTKNGYARLVDTLSKYPDAISAGDAYMRRFMPEGSTDPADAVSRMQDVEELLPEDSYYGRARQKLKWARDKGFAEWKHTKVDRNDVAEATAVRDFFPSNYIFIEKGRFAKAYLDGDYEQELSEGDEMYIKIGNAKTGGHTTEIDGVGIRIWKKSGDLHKEIVYIQETTTGGIENIVDGENGKIKQIEDDVDELRENGLEIETEDGRTLRFDPDEVASDLRTQIVVPRGIDVSWSDIRKAERNMGRKVEYVTPGTFDNLEMSIQELKNLDRMQTEFKALEYVLTDDRPS